MHTKSRDFWDFRMARVFLLLVGWLDGCSDARCLFTFIFGDSSVPLVFAMPTSENEWCSYVIWRTEAAARKSIGITEVLNVVMWLHLCSVQSLAYQHHFSNAKNPQLYTAAPPVFTVIHSVALFLLNDMCVCVCVSTHVIGTENAKNALPFIWSINSTR